MGDAAGEELRALELLQCLDAILEGALRLLGEPAFGDIENREQDSVGGLLLLDDTFEHRLESGSRPVARA